MINLSAKTVEVLAAYLKKMVPYGKKQIRFVFTNKEANAEAVDLLKADLSGVYQNSYSEGGKAFRLSFSDTSTRTQVLSEIKQSVASFNDSGSGIGPKLKSWAVYLAIGAAAIVIILLIANRKK